MKYNLLLLTFVFSLFHSASHAQCNPAIPSTAKVNTIANQVWLCSGDTFSTVSGGVTYFMESGSVLTHAGGSNIVYLKQGAKINISGTGNTTVYYEDTTDIIKAGNGPIIIKCASIVFDYTNAPSEGCLVTGIVARHSTAIAGIEVYPNPAKNKIMVSSSLLASTNAVLEVRNLLGKNITPLATQISKSGLQREMDISNFSPGIYFLRIIVGQKFSVQKLIVE